MSRLFPFKPSDPLREVAIIGGGHQSAVGPAHISALRMLGIQVTAACFSRSPEVNQQSAIEYGLSSIRLFDSLQSLLTESRTELKTVILLTPTNQHLHQLLELATNFENIICEKSLATSYQDLFTHRNELRKSRIFAISNYTAFPMVQLARKLVADGSIGAPRYWHVEMLQSGFVMALQRNRTIQDWRTRDYELPTVTLDLGIHVEMLTHYILAQRPRAVSSIETSSRHLGVVEAVQAIGRYASGLTSQLRYGKGFAREQNSLGFSIHGDEGSLSWTIKDSESLYLASGDGEERRIGRHSTAYEMTNIGIRDRFKPGHPIGFVESLANYYLQINDCLTGASEDGNPSNVVELEEAIDDLSVLNSIHQAALNESWMRVETSRDTI